MRRIPAPLAVAALLPFLAQATGAANLPALAVSPPGAFLPPAGRPAFAARPAPAKAAVPAGPSWLDSARVVAAYVAEQAREALKTRPAPLPAEAAPREAPVPVPEPDAPPPASPPAQAPRDRMLIAMEPGVRVVGVIAKGDVDFSAPPPAALSFAAPPLPPFREPWIEQSGLRARVGYRNPHGLVRGFSDGFVATFAGGAKRMVEGTVPPAYRRTFPIYWHGEQIEVELELVNETGRALRGLSVEAVQESFRPVGGEGTRLAPPADVEVPRVLPPGARVVVRWWVRLEGPGHAAVNLEQTHVRVSEGPDASAAPLLDAPQAGVVDPPGPGLL